jgi:hypothetical protein
MVGNVIRAEVRISIHIVNSYSDIFKQVSHIVRGDGSF